MRREGEGADDWFPTGGVSVGGLKTTVVEVAAHRRPGQKVAQPTDLALTGWKSRSNGAKRPSLLRSPNPVPGSYSVAKDPFGLE